MYMVRAQDKTTGAFVASWRSADLDYLLRRPLAEYTDFSNLRFILLLIAEPTPIVIDRLGEFVVCVWCPVRQSWESSILLSPEEVALCSV